MSEFPSFNPLWKGKLWINATCRIGREARKKDACKLQIYRANCSPTVTVPYRVRCEELFWAPVVHQPGRPCRPERPTSVAHTLPISAEQWWTMVIIILITNRIWCWLGWGALTERLHKQNYRKHSTRFENGRITNIKQDRTERDWRTERNYITMTRTSFTDIANTLLEIKHQAN